jgi:hypothetical protein
VVIAGARQARSPIDGYVTHGGTYRHLQHYLERALAEAK